MWKIETTGKCFNDTAAFFTRTFESNENTTKASDNVATLIAKHCKPFTDGEFIRDWVMKIMTVHFLISPV